MKMEISEILESIYVRATSVARGQPSQTVGEKKDYYITLEQLEYILKCFQN